MKRTEEIPAVLAHLTVEPKRGLPIPFANVVMPDGEPDFTTVDSAKIWECARDGLCGVCGKRLDYWICFLGGPKSVIARTYLDPPMHRDCALAAVALCPFMAMPSMARRKTPISPDSGLPDGWVAERPEVFVLYVTRRFTAKLHNDSILFIPAAPHHTEVLEETRA